MIKGILFAVFIILLVVCLGLVILFAYRSARDDGDRKKLKRDLAYLESNYENTCSRINSQTRLPKETRDQMLQEAKDEYDNKVAKLKADCGGTLNKKLSIGFGTVALAALAITIFVPGSFHQVEAGTYAVVKEVGRIVDVRTPGTYFDFYMTRQYETYDATVQQVKINTAAYSKDGQTMDLEVYLQYQIQLDKLVIKDEYGNIIQTEGIAGKYVTLQSLQDRIETQCIEKTKSVMSSAEAMTIIQDRALYSELVSETVRNAIGPDYYVNVQDVVLTNIDFTDEFEKSVEDKVVAEQQRQAAETKAKADAEVVRIKAENEKDVAEIEAEKKKIEAEADAAVVRIAAEAEAKATVAKIIEIARTVGFTVNETETGYEIVFDDIHTEAMFKEVVQQYLEYLAYLDKWNGELPKVVSGTDGLSIIVPNE